MIYGYYQAKNYQDLIDYIKKNGWLKTPEIIETFLKFDRKEFLPEELQKIAYLDAPLPIGQDVGQTCSQPTTVAFLIELLEPKKGSNLLADLVGEKGKVYAIEIDENIFNFGKKNIEKFNFIEKKTVEIFLGDGSKGLKEKAPFDRILVSAFSPVVPQELIDQLNENGILVIPDFEGLQKIKKVNGKTEKEYFWGFEFGPLKQIIK
ncbi:MAG: protein-L-isoaspartate O-methyltransferase [Patescibacteria group bacterium]